MMINNKYHAKLELNLKLFVNNIYHLYRHTIVNYIYHLRNAKAHETDSKFDYMNLSIKDILRSE